MVCLSSNLSSPEAVLPTNKGGLGDLRRLGKVSSDNRLSNPRRLGEFDIYTARVGLSFFCVWISW